MSAHRSVSPLTPLPALVLAGAMAAGLAPAQAAAEPGFPVRYTVRADWTLNHYGKDAYECWNDGQARRCGNTPTQLEGETELRLMVDHELSDLLELRLQLGGEAYHNNGWTERSARATGKTRGSRPTWVAHVLDTWVGLHHEDLGTLRIGTGLNPFQQASGQMDGNTDLGGKEYLERMVAYDSPLLLGDKATGVRLNLAFYDGARYRKARYEQAPEDKARAARARGVALLLDGKVNGNITTRLALYAERYTARKYYGVGPLDGDYGLVPGGGATAVAFNEENPALTAYLGNGAKARSRGIAVEAAYEGNSFRVGAQLLHNRRLGVDDLRTATFAQNGHGSGYASTGAALYFSTWSGPWSLWSKAYSLNYRLTDADRLTTASDWMYPNSTFVASRVAGEVGYALTDHVRAIVGVEWNKRDFKESPLAGGACSTGKANACYDPQGYRFFTGVRSNF